ncbi:hypothetical protein SISNIDRAFT_448982 [Sistotremastrum niveocremeum HHB9708]|uniref:Fe2OG dioxygenase domain-containing protein n=1 Tax=Sistotremastrum niveocremeum HHB9708 TaxID=1314777 RepID=A0A165AA43_9AGAM|nr:hypothetical protein SISNIDRAFT_448982 [Sistotremastrum niveocremeum HHB9708]
MDASRAGNPPWMDRSLVAQEPFQSFFSERYANSSSRRMKQVKILDNEAIEKFSHGKPMELINKWWGVAVSHWCLDAPNPTAPPELTTNKEKVAKWIEIMAELVDPNDRLAVLRAKGIFEAMARRFNNGQRPHGRRATGKKASQSVAPELRHRPGKAKGLTRSRRDSAIVAPMVSESDDQRKAGRTSRRKKCTPSPSTPSPTETDRLDMDYLSGPVSPTTMIGSPQSGAGPGSSVPPSPTVVGTPIASKMGMSSEFRSQYQTPPPQRIMIVTPDRCERPRIDPTLTPPTPAGLLATSRSLSPRSQSVTKSPVRADFDLSNLLSEYIANARIEQNKKARTVQKRKRVVSSAPDAKKSRKKSRTDDSRIPSPSTDTHDAEPQSKNDENSSSLRSSSPHASISASLIPREFSRPRPNPGDAPPANQCLPLPPIWCTTRQELCEATECFRSWQGGVYTAGGIAKGYLLDACPSQRDEWQHGGKLIISHGGGGSGGTNRKSGAPVEPRDQDENLPSVRGLLKAERERQPVVLVAGSRYLEVDEKLAKPLHPDVGYAVLGWYYIVFSWSEYQEITIDGSNKTEGSETKRLKRRKFIFQWMEEQGAPWWLSDKGSESQRLIKQEEEAHLISFSEISPSNIGSQLDHRVELNPKVRDMVTSTLYRSTEEREVNDEGQSTSKPSFGEQVYLYQCSVCNQDSTQVYKEDWFCLNEKCPSFFETRQGSPAPTELNYCTEFLSLRSVEYANKVPGDRSSPWRPPFEMFPTHVDLRQHFSREFWRGWRCHTCGKLSCRIYWEYWKCSNLFCRNEVQIRHGTTVPTKDLLTTAPRTKTNVEFVIPSLQSIHKQCEDGIFIHEMYEVPVFLGLSEDDLLTPICDWGQIHILRDQKENQIIASLFEEYQRVANTSSFFQRHAAHNPNTRREIISMYFSQNSGVPYKYIGQAEFTTPLNVAADPVKKALALIQNRVKLLIPGVRFNEILTAAYMEDQKMMFHSDDEPGLGPIVASISMGSRARMEFRGKQKIGGKKKVLSFDIDHGDVVVMTRGIQETYQHAVFPTGLRIAATARYINTDGIPQIS